MHESFKLISLCLNIILLNSGTHSNLVISVYKGQIAPGNVRLKRQDGYVYDKPTVSFDLPTATYIAPTQAPTVDRIQMQMYYAYPVPAGGADATVSGGQSIATSGGTSTAVSSGTSGYNYEVQNAQTDSQSNTAVSSGTGGYNYEVQNSQTGSQSNTLTETQNTVKTSGYNYNAPIAQTGNTITETKNTVTGYQNTAISGTQTVVNSGSTGYSADRPIQAFNSGSGVTTGSVSTSAPRYLPPQSSDGNTGAVTVTTNNQVQTVPKVTQISENYIPPNTQAKTNSATSSANAPNTGYLSPSAAPQQTPIIVSNPTSSTGRVQTRPVSVPTQQYLPPLESSGGSRSELPVAVPASTYLPPVY